MNQSCWLWLAKPPKHFIFGPTSNGTKQQRTISPKFRLNFRTLVKISFADATPTCLLFFYVKLCHFSLYGFEKLTF